MVMCQFGMRIYLYALAPSIFKANWFGRWVVTHS